MTCKLEKLNEVTTIRPIPISLPNNTHTLAKKKGMVTLEKGDALQDILYVPELDYNLLSVAKLCRDLKCTVTFSDKSCVLQDCTSRTPIGVGEQRDGVYYYSGTPQAKNQVNVVGTRQLWHHRFGHTSHEVMLGFFKNL